MGEVHSVERPGGGGKRLAHSVCSTDPAIFNEVGLLSDLRLLIQSARQRVASAASAATTLLSEFGVGFSYAALTRMVRFAEWMTDLNILATLSQELSWRHFIELLPIKDPVAREFYAEMCRLERWDVRTLRRKIGGMLFERTALSKKPKTLVAAEIAKLRDGQMSPHLGVS
ncbi:MAG: DUF1016 N-terminal domain-containing protein [bacterium]|nr:DUF1016 N-terminal domain-containing protein [bacterium]